MRDKEKQIEEMAKDIYATGVATGIPVSCISRCCNGNRISTNGFEWRFK